MKAVKFVNSLRAATRLVFALGGLAVVSACGSGGGDSNANVPSVPLNLSVNLGDGSVSLGWDPPASDGGAGITGYTVSVQPPTAVLVTSTHAIVRNLTNGSNYSITVAARNAAGVGTPTAPITVTPHATTTATYTGVSVQGDTSPSGIYDGALLRAANGDLWLSYSSVDYHLNGASQLVQDVGIRLAKSTNNGTSFSYVVTVATPGDTTVTDTDPNRGACGAVRCTGRWVYETSWVIDDSTDTNANRRYKLFAHKYFLYPPGPVRTLYYLGSIVMFTAPQLEGPWSTDTSLLGWNLTPPELTPLRVVNSLSPDLAPCLAIAEGGATVRGSTIDFVFACTYPGANPLPQKIVLLRSQDHANTFQYVSTLLSPSDAAGLDANFFTAPGVSATANNAPLLLATPALNNVYRGCIAFPIADVERGEMFRSNGQTVGILYAPPNLNHLAGACTYDRGISAKGLVINDAVLGNPVTATRFGIQSTNSGL